MEILKEKLQEVLVSVGPIIGLVLLLSIFMVEVEADMMARFVIGSCLLIIGLTLFLLGVEVGMSPIGHLMGRQVVDSTKPIFVLLLAFLIGFSVTVAEPDLLILGQEVSKAMGGALSAAVIVGIVSFGVGILISFGVIRILRTVPVKYFFTICYGLVACLALLVSNDYLAIAFDASGATTGALTTPFILALSMAIAARKGGHLAEEDSFGLVGAMSVGPILAVILMALIFGVDFHGNTGAYQYTSGIFQPFMKAIFPTLGESLMALAPLVVLFFYYNFRHFKLKNKQFLKIMIGIGYTLIGLVLFLIGVNQGFMDMGRYLGAGLAQDYADWLPWIAFVLGLVVVLAEPAVHVLGDQVEEVTGGFIKQSLLMAALSIGVGIAVSGSIWRIIIPEIAIWHYLLPGFALAILLSFLVDDLFTGIAYDAGGVASGPMTATFILAFSQGAADFIPTADVVTDGFGLIATVAMTPIIMIQLLGLIYKLKLQAKSK